MAIAALTEADPAAEEPAAPNGVADLLTRLLEEVVEARVPALARLFSDSARLDPAEPALMVAALQAVGIHFQLMRIAEESLGMNKRRAVERAGGPDSVIGSFAHTLSQAAALGVEPPEVARALGILEVAPTLTADREQARDGARTGASTACCSTWKPAAGPRASATR